MLDAWRHLPLHQRHRLRHLPWPQRPTHPQMAAVALNAVALRQLRREVMEKMDWSLRDLYRTLDEPGRNPLRDAQAELDAAVRAAYGMKPPAPTSSPTSSPSIKPAPPARPPVSPSLRPACPCLKISTLLLSPTTASAWKHEGETSAPHWHRSRADSIGRSSRPRPQRRRAR